MPVVFCNVPVTSATGLCQSANLLPSSASLICSNNQNFCSKSSISVGKCSRRSFNTYALASESNGFSDSTSILTVPTLYDILGIKQDVGLLEIKSAFRQLARQHHPDLCSSSADAAKATTRFIQVKEAYDTLSNPHLKAAYDQQLGGSRFSNFAFFKLGNIKRTSKRWQAASPHLYRDQWEDQLSGLRNKSQGVDWPVLESGGSSWGARMRQRMQEENLTPRITSNQLQFNLVRLIVVNKGSCKPRFCPCSSPVQSST